MIIDCIAGFVNITTDPATFIQGAIPHILKKTYEDFFKKIINLLKQDADICYDGLKEISCITCPHKPEGSMFVMVKLDTSLLEDISDDMDFCMKFAKEESVIILPGTALGLEGGWLRITFAVEPSILKEGFERMKAFCQRHAKKTRNLLAA